MIRVYTHNSWETAEKIQWVERRHNPALVMVGGECHKVLLNCISMSRELKHVWLTTSDISEKVVICRKELDIYAGLSTCI